MATKTYNEQLASIFGLPKIKTKSFYELSQEEKEQLKKDYVERNNEDISDEELEAAYKDVIF